MPKGLWTEHVSSMRDEDNETMQGLPNKRVKHKWEREKKSFPSQSTRICCGHRSMRGKEKLPNMPRGKEKVIFILIWEKRVKCERPPAESFGEYLAPHLEHKPVTIFK